jgi:tetratricopeptide (TPR) repeat protein
VKAGRELAAAAVITGTLTGHGDAARVQVDVIDVSRGAQVWGRSYEAASSQLMALQGRISEDLVHAMRLPLTPAQRINLIRRPTEDSEAYQAWLQGRYFWSQRSEPGLKRAIEQFRLAIERDPRFALAYAGLADAHATLGYLGYVAPRDTFPEARAFALKALELDPSLAEAHASLGYIKFYFDRDWAGAEAELRRAIALNDRNPVSHQWYAVYLLATGRNDAAFREIQIAHELDPLSLAINTDLGFHHYYNGRYADAISQLESVLKMNGDFLLANLCLGRAYLKVGRFDDALSQFARAEAKVRDWPVLVTARGNAYGVAGRTAEARAVLAEMEALSRTRFVTAYGMALIYAGMRETDPAFEWLDKAFEERSHWLVWLKLDPRWDVLRGDPRFEQLIARMKYPS